MTILFYPDPLNDNSKMYKLCSDLNINYHSDPTLPHDIHIFWSITRSKIDPDYITIKSIDVINRGCYNITKRKVNDIFDDIEIDPTSHIGKCVEKLDLQALHSYHSIIQCPSEPRRETARFKENGVYVEVEANYIYQKLIINKEDDLYYRYRIYYAGEITHIVKIYQSDPFKTDIIRCELVPIRSVYTEATENELDLKCKLFGFDLGELDVMIIDNKPVVIDVNNIIGGGSIPTLTDTGFADSIKHATYNYLVSKIIKHK